MIVSIGTVSLPIILALRRLRQEDHEFEANLSQKNRVKRKKNS